MILIIVLALATILLAAWIVLLFMASREDWIAAAYNKVLDNRAAIVKLRQKDEKNAEKLAQMHGIAAAITRLFLGSGSEKEIQKLEKKNAALQQGNMKSLSVLDMPGYVLFRKFDSIGYSSFHKAILTNCIELHGKKYAENKAKQLIARMFSYAIIGVALSLALGALVMGAGNSTMGIAVMGIGTVLVAVLVYALYDDVSDKVKKRRADIARQFPNMVSKLALLVTSGMIVSRAWNETACSQNATLYLEMQKTAEELDNLVAPEAAYGAFITRCNTKETTKLASAIMQNLSKGNAEMGKLLKDMAKEAWLERRHTAKRDSEKANSMLMIPTMLLFVAILIMIMVPVAMNFGSL